MLQLPAQRTSINVSLGHKLFTFDYNNPSSICNIPSAARNVGLVWGIFAAVLVLTLICVKVWQKRKQGSRSTSAVVLHRVATMFRNTMARSHMQLLKRIADKMLFLASDVLWFIYSQVTDAVTIHQVFQSGQLKYACVLLAILVLPFAVMFLLIVRASVKALFGRFVCVTKWQRFLVFVVGLMLSPFHFFLFEIALVAHGFGVPLPLSFESLSVDSFAFLPLTILG